MEDGVGGGLGSQWPQYYSFVFVDVICFKHCRFHWDFLCVFAGESVDDAKICFNSLTSQFVALQH